MAKRSKQRTLEIVLPPLHSGQREVLDMLGTVRFLVAAMSRRYGKTFMGGWQVLSSALETGGHYFWLAPSYRRAQEGFDVIDEMVSFIPGSKVHIHDKRFDLPNGGRISIGTTRDPHEMRGKGLDGVVLDEAAYMTPETWVNVVRPTLLISKGWALLLSTPFGLNWFYEEYKKGESADPLFSEWHSMRRTIYDNPMLTPEQIEQERLTTPPNVWAVEYMAEFLDTAGAVFLNPGAVMTAPLYTRPQDVEGHALVGGLDWGRVRDYTVISLFDVVDKMNVYTERFQGPWHVQRERIRQVVDHWKPSVIWAEANSAGDVNIGALQELGLKEIKPFQTTPKSKRIIIEALALAVADGDIMLQNTPERYDEYLTYRQEVNAAGQVSYSAPKHGNDDIVMADAMAWFGVDHAFDRSVVSVRYAGLYGAGGRTERRQYGVNRRRARLMRTDNREGIRR